MTLNRSYTKIQVQIEVQTPEHNNTCENGIAAPITAVCLLLRMSKERWHQYLPLGRTAPTLLVQQSSFAVQA